MKWVSYCTMDGFFHAISFPASPDQLKGLLNIPHSIRFVNTNSHAPLFSARGEKTMLDFID